MMWMSKHKLNTIYTCFLKSLNRISYKYQNASLSSTELNSLIDINPKLKNQISTGEAVVALESTIITHGMPYPKNVDTALEVEDLVKAEGSIPATIAVMDGRIKVGLEKDELKRLGYISKDKNSEKVIKCSKKDLAYAICKKICGGTTVAGTLWIANKVGIKVFATGGIGGVHRNVQDSFDISADLVELGKTPIAVICSGVKSILDIPKTLEFLETEGVLVASYQSPSYEFPAFYATSSGCKVPYNLSNPKEAAILIKCMLELKLNSGILIGASIPRENAVPANLINNAITSALNDCKSKGIIGKEVTPFLLEEIANKTKGQSLNSNIALIKNNAKIASQIAIEFCKIYRSEIKVKNQSITNKNYLFENELTDDSNKQKLQLSSELDKSFQKIRLNIPVVIGASIFDIVMRVQDNFKLDGATYCTDTKMSGGGVGRNIAEALWKLYGNVNFISVVGTDDLGKKLVQTLPENCKKSIIDIRNKTTSMCNVIFDKMGDCKLVLGNMEIHKEISPDLIKSNVEVVKKAPLIVIDGNLTVQSIEKVLELSKQYDKPVFYEPTDMRIAGKPFNLPLSIVKQIKFISPNLYELQTISNVINNKDTQINIKANIFDHKTETLKIAAKLLNEVYGFFDCIILTLGSLGVIIDGEIDIDHVFFNKNCIYQKNKFSKRKILYFEAPKVEDIVNVSGAGDSFCGGFIAAMLQKKNLKECVEYGFSSATSALKSDSAVPETYQICDDKINFTEIRQHSSSKELIV